MHDLESIYRYIVHLRDHYGLMITLHPMQYETVISSSRLMVFNVHENPYCLYLKTSKELWSHCVECQKRVMEKSKDGSYCGTCHAGVKEFIYPLHREQEIVGFISVSGYQTEKPDSYIRKIAMEYDLNRTEIQKIYKELYSQIPDTEFMDTLIEPLCAMIELAYVHHQGEYMEEQSFVQRVLHYLRVHHTRKISVQELCEVFYCSRSYISHEFKKHTGSSINEYINELRIKDAKNMLRHTDLSIGEIAVAVGYGGSNYFANVFTAAVGTSPREYRKENR